MPNWTKEQTVAIQKENTNIIVSAGAGSGKTAVLSERVIRKLEQGVNIDQLLVLTFTKAAAFEMMIRIRDKIKERPHLKKQLDKIDTAYITTFDSFSLSLVKKYHYLLDLPKIVKIVDQTIINIEKKRLLDELFEQYYQNPPSNFLSLLTKYTFKDDAEIRQLILNINNRLDLKYNKKEYLDTYVEQIYNPENIQLFIQDYEAFLCQKISFIKEKFEELANEVDGDYQFDLETSLKPLFDSKTYDEFQKAQPVKLKSLPRGSEDFVKKKKEELSSLLKEFQKYTIYSSQVEIQEHLENTKQTAEIIIQILLDLDSKIELYKKEHIAYEFTDIAKMAIQLLKENDSIRDELKQSFNEIMIDEYQDTSDLQEEFIQMISCNNVYMVGDIKQSIYRFRNANPYIFKDKYDAYAQNNGGFKIDLMKNFRSRKEVLDNINFIFNFLMDESLGGCKYQEGHQMIFGNTMYEENKEEKQPIDFDIYHYPVEKDIRFTKDEIEAYIVLKDIEEKIHNHYQVIDKKTSKLRDCSYKDFTILMDRATQFELYKKIFEHKNVPLIVYKDVSITREDDVYVFSNLLKLIYLCYHEDYQEEFRYTFLSIARSYLCDMKDDEIFEIFQNKTYFNSDIYQKASLIVKDYNRLNGVALLEKIIDVFHIYERQILVGKVENLLARSSYLKQLFEEMDQLGYSLDEIILNFNQMISEGYDIKISLTEEQEDAVKIMTIHKSKGLEFPILYMTGFSNKFNIQDLNEKFIFDSKYGIVVPFYKEQELTPITKILMKDQYIKEEISEKIRLFYVALTRAKEKMIFVMPTIDVEKAGIAETADIVNTHIRYRYRSFLDMMKSIWFNLEPYKVKIELETLGLSKDYNLIKKSNYQNTLVTYQEPIQYKLFSVDTTTIETSHFSKTTTDLLTIENYQSIELGKKFHTIFETLDFQNPNYEGLTTFERKHIENFLNQPILKDIEQAIIYQEYEFIIEEGNQMKHGIIDLLIEYSDKIIIVDYKLKQTEDDAYKMQLEGYKDYIVKKTAKKVEVYLYSILDNQLKQVDCFFLFN